MSKSIYTEKLGKNVAKRARGISKYHVISSQSNKWAVVSEGSVKPVKTFIKRSEAINYAKGVASKSGRNVVVHTKTGW